MDEGRIILPARKPPLTSEQRVGIGFVFVCALGGLILGGFYLWKHAAVPFVITYTGPRFQTSDEQEAAEIAQLRSADTDEDGVSDYDERFVFKTSAYLADTDGDSIPDGTEILAGDDPLCIPGEVCEADTVVEDPDAVLPANASGTFLSDVPEPIAPEGIDSVLDANSSVSAGGAEEIDFANLSTADVRLLLVTLGASEVDIAKLSDEQVQEMYQNALSQAQQLETSQ